MTDQSGPADTGLTRTVEATMAAAAASIGEEMIDQATNYFGALRHETRERLRALIEQPSPDTWDNAHSIILNANTVGLGRTLWQAVLRVDPNAPDRASSDGTASERWDGYFPDPMTTVLAIANAVGEPPRTRR